MPGKTAPDPAGKEQLLPAAERERELRQQGYREKALKLFPWICARCGRDFSGRKVRDLTVHHKDHNHDASTATTTSMAEKRWPRPVHPCGPERSRGRRPPTPLFPGWPACSTERNNRQAAHGCQLTIQPAWAMMRGPTTTPQTRQPFACP